MIVRFAAGRSLLVVLIGFSSWLVMSVWLSVPSNPLRTASLGWLFPALSAESAVTSANFPDLVEKVKPAVIAVRAKAMPPDRLPREGRVRQGEPDTPLGIIPDEPDLPRRPGLTTSQGSGFFVHPDGYAVTTNHVIEGSKAIEISTDDGKSYPARLVGSDPSTDLALLKVEGAPGFPFVRLADKAPRVGEWVLAIGNPFGLGGTVTAGIISGRARDIGLGTMNDFLQIDAPVNQGNSGGPTFDLNGDVVGVNSAIFSPSGGSVGIGFAIPAETVKPVIAQLKDKGKVIRGWLGVEIQPITLDIAENLGLKQVKGALVARQQSNSPAAKAGIMSGDIITSLNGASVGDARDLIRRIGNMAPGTPVNLVVSRKGEEKMVTVMLGELPNSGSTGGEVATPR